jgi:hypothetical protein
MDPAFAGSIKGVGGWDLIKLVFYLPMLFLSSGKKVCLSESEQQGGQREICKFLASIWHFR